MHAIARIRQLRDGPNKRWSEELKRPPMALALPALHVALRLRPAWIRAATKDYGKGALKLFDLDQIVGLRVA